MSDTSEPGQVTDATLEAEAVDEQQQGRAAGQPPTPEEEAAADRTADAGKGVEEPYREMTEKGAHIKGEGAIEG
ncbi:MAG: hypothetical protein JWN46_1883 [Acidimicrobiales bacterium]|nr:hypothetical protein [Acidimicrobiales bacterium]